VKADGKKRRCIIDVTLSLNGLPLGTAELKDPLTGQRAANAVGQYCNASTTRLAPSLGSLGARGMPWPKTSPNIQSLDSRIGLAPSMTADFFAMGGGLKRCPIWT
jgi:hypothetical protein